MRDIPECLNRRYKALDKLIKELHPNNSSDCKGSEKPSCEESGVGVKLLCDFWDILQNDPDCNLTAEVQQRMCSSSKEARSHGTQSVKCFMAAKDQGSEKKRETHIPRVKCIHVPKEPSPCKKHVCCVHSCETDKMPLNQVLCNLKQAASFDKKCNDRVAELLSAQKDLSEQIQNLEEKEKRGVSLLKEADCMWSSMEDAYKTKVAESQERQKILLKELREIEASANKWRKNKKDLEFKLTNINQSNEQINAKINEKKNDLKVMDIEIVDLTKRIASIKKDLDNASNLYRSKRQAHDGRMAKIAMDMTALQKKIGTEYKNKADKENVGTKFVKEARDDLQKICRVLLRKKLENEDLRAEKDSLLEEVELLKQTCDACQEKCRNKENSIDEELKRVKNEISNHKNICIKCHKCLDTVDIRKFCTDCPRCIAERDCLTKGDHCSTDISLDCVCMSIKEKFLDNVFENMYTVLERQVKTCPGREVADCVLHCLKRSRNGKLNTETRKVLQEFILSTVKKNLNLTIVGGAVKTRCEMDKETYDQLMLCLKDVAVTRPPKQEKGTAKKEPCDRWGGSMECNCPKGPTACICVKKAPKPPNEPTSCGGGTDQQIDSGEKTCPQRESLACITDCGMPGVNKIKREPCAGQSCLFSKNMRAAQCVLGSESLEKNRNTPPIMPNIPNADNLTECSCGGKAVKTCPCHKDRSSQPRYRIIEEVMGRNTEVSPIEKVRKTSAIQTSQIQITSEIQQTLKVPEVFEVATRRIESGCNCSYLPMKYLLASHAKEHKIGRYCACSNNYVSNESRKPFLKKLRKKGHLNICFNRKHDHVVENVALVPDNGLQPPQKMQDLKNNSDNDVKIILCPKFLHNNDDKIVLSLSTDCTYPSESADSKLKSKSSLKTDQELDSYDASFVGRKVCDTVKELMKDIVVPQMPPTTKLSSDAEWVDMDSLSKETSSLTKLNGSSTHAVNHVEVKCDTLKDKGEKEAGSISVHNSMIGEQQKTSSNEREHSNDTNDNNNYKSTNGDDLKLQLLNKIRQTYNLCGGTSFENVKELSSNVNDLLNFRKCLRNLDDTVTGQNGCDCINTQIIRKDDCRSNLKKSKKCDTKHDKGKIKKCLVGTSDISKGKLEKSFNKGLVKKQVQNKFSFFKKNKNKKGTNKNK